MEYWKDILDWEGLYQVSNLGRVKSLEKNVVYKDGTIHHRKERILRLGKHTQGYSVVHLSKEGEVFAKYIHVLQSQVFIPNPNNLPEINHKDENKSNNYIHINDDGSVNPELSNLEWVSHKDNINHGTRNERCRQKNSKPVVQYDMSGNYIAEYESIKMAAALTNMNEASIGACCLGKRIKTIKDNQRYTWRYKD